ncbi:ArsC family reductase [Gilvimarinus sp. DA14]|uniref:ArsC family reductase n=1 Tax=Gilvimarinus sp. DA14 TaxID=2956798 RepID=UPI0020B7DD91|nr:ArsC family reductase [Gilvimarinus sp. DA14]UTF60492.1 ArsC family reductase [Gilvimarinus sp. DA14]
MATTTLYGIKNCDTVKKARRWLEDAGVNYAFHDFRSDGLSAELVQAWLETLGSAALVNKRSTTWKNLTDAQKQQAEQGDVLNLLLEHPTLIKRPVIDTGNQVQVGFKADQYAELFH